MKNNFSSMIILLLFSGLFFSACSKGFVETVKEIAVPFKDCSDITHLTDHIDGQKLVLLGEASHGTSQYYTMRAEISKKLISEKGYSFIAVEGD